MDEFLHSAPFGYFEFNEHGFLIRTNNAFCQLVGSGAADVAGQHVEKYFTLPSRIFYQTHLFPLLSIQGHAEEIFLTLLSGTKEIVPVLLNAEKKLSEGHLSYACAFIVVRHRKKFEEELVAARKQAEQAVQENAVLQQLRDQLLQQKVVLDDQLITVSQQNEDLKQFTRIVTHELQEPLRKISLFTNMLDSDAKAGFSPENILQRLLRASAQMRNVISGLQQYLWLQEKTLQFEPVNISRLLQEGKAQLETEQGENILDLHIEGAPDFYADPEQLKILCYQLLSNSVKFRKPGAAADVDVTFTQIRKNKYRESPESYAYIPFLKIDFTDKGKGFDPKYREQVFQLFERLEQNDGRGMGLALCKRIVTNHGGIISIDTELAKGTTVSVLLPIRYQ